MMPDDRIPLGPGGEFDRLRAVFARLGSRIRGVGDDAALIPVDDLTLAWSSDLAVEGRHFRLDWLTPREIGWRACAAALSDLAAVAAEPIGVLAAVGVPAGRDGAFFEDLVEGVSRAARSAGADLWGGDLVRAEQVVLDVSVLGRADRPMRRRGARPGDVVWVTGTFGGPRAAVAAWEAGDRPGAALRPRFAHPVPRIAEAQWLRDRGATAMIDVSDGLIGDAGHVAAASGVELTLISETVPVHPGVGAPDHDATVEAVLTGGEEYELLVTLPPAFEARDAAAFRRRFDLELTRIGSVGPGKGVVALYGGEPVQLSGGFSHF